MNSVMHLSNNLFQQNLHIHVNHSGQHTGGGNVLKSVMQLADEGVEHLVVGRSKPAGAAREATLLGSLRVLVTALQTDVWLLQELRQVPSTGEQREHQATVCCCHLKRLRSETSPHCRDAFYCPQTLLSFQCRDDVSELK